MTRRRALRWLGVILLAAWGGGLGSAAYQLRMWQAEASAVLVQIQADERLRRLAIGAPDTLQPQWYRARALALLSAAERLRGGGTWTWVIPGSWQVFDDLEERATAHVVEAFGRIVVQTIRREIETRAAQVTGVALGAGHTPAVPARACAGLPPWTKTARPTLALTELPELVAIHRFVEEAQRLEVALDTLETLQGPSAAKPDDLRALVRYSLGAELPAPSARSIGMFQAASQDQVPGETALRARVEATLVCGATRGMEALHARLAAGNPLLDQEERLALLLREALFEDTEDAGATGSLRGAPWRAREALLLLEKSRAMRNASPHDWMTPGGDTFGAWHEDLLTRMAGNRLLGRDLVIALRQDARLWHTRMQARLLSLSHHTDLALVWSEASRRLEDTPRRAALHEGIERLLRGPLAQTGTPAPGAATIDALLSLVETHEHVARDVLPLLPETQRPAARAWVDRQVAGHALALAQRQADAGDPERVVQRITELQSALDAAGAPTLATWVGQRVLEERLSLPPDPTPPSGGEDAGAAPASSAD